MKTVHIYHSPRPDLAGCHPFEEMRYLPKIFKPDGLSITIGRWPSKTADVSICQDTGHVLPNTPFKTGVNAFWCLHCHTDYHQQFAQEFDFSFGADLRYIEEGLFDHWLPNGAGFYALRKAPQAKPEFDVGLVGQMIGQRVKAIPVIRAICQRNGWSTYFHDAGYGVKGKEGTADRPNWKSIEEFGYIIRSCRIWLNVTTVPYADLLSNRMFEAMVMERPCVSDLMYGQDKLAPEGCGVLYYDWRQPESVEEPIRRLLSDAEFYQQVKEHGSLVAVKHTIEARYRQLFQILGVTNA